MEQSLLTFSQAIQQPRLGAGFGLRAVAQIIDLIIHNVVGIIVGLIGGVLIGIYAGITGTPLSTLTTKLEGVTPMGLILAGLGYVLYHAICEGVHGATLGKLICRLHVIGENGKPAPIGPAFIRSLAFFIDGLFFGIVAAVNMNSSQLKQRLGDKWAKTVVVERISLTQFPWPSGWKFLIAFIIALMVDGLMTIISMVLRFL